MLFEDGYLPNQAIWFQQVYALEHQDLDFAE